jgi:hypothetical protein
MLFWMLLQEGKVALGVPITDGGGSRTACLSRSLVDFDDEVGMIHSIAHNFESFGIQEGTVGLKHTFPTQSMADYIQGRLECV